MVPLVLMTLNPWPVLFWIVLPLMAKLPETPDRLTPLTPPLEEMLSKVTASAPLARLTAPPPVLATETLLMVSDPTLEPLMPVPLLTLIFRPRTVFPEASVTLEMVGRVPAAMERFGAMARPTPLPINCWLL